MSVQVVKIGLNQLEHLRSVAIRTFDETFRQYNTPENMQLYFDTSLSREQLTKELNTQGAEFFFAMVDGKVSGYLKTCVNEAQTDPFGDDAFQIERIYILQEFQRKGIGSILLKKALQLGKEYRKKFAWLGVWEHNDKALTFYKKFGFHQIGSHTFNLGDDPQTDLIFRLDFQYE